MRTALFLLCFLFFHRVSHASNYYFSALSGDDSRSAAAAQNPATPWKSLEKFNAINSSLRPGDSVFFQRGETFFGTMNVRSSGVSGNVIYYGAYGSGANPVISGLVTLTNWTLYSSGIYYVSLDMPNLNLVTINGEAKGKGRYPNTGYLNYENNNQNLSITDNELPASPNWTGAEIAMRKFRFIIDRHVVTNHSGKTLTYSTSTVNGNNDAYNPVKENGYFFQNHLLTLDQFGEWCYDETARRLYIYFGANAPSAYVVNASTKELNASLEGVNYITLDNLDFEGGNVKGMNISLSTNVNLQNCNFSNQGAFSIYGAHISFVTVKGGSVKRSMSNGINFEFDANNCTIDGVSVSSTNMIAGMGRSGSGVGLGICVTGDNTVISNNRVIGTGLSGIQFLGDNVLVEKNYIDSVCTIKDDGGGIYTYLGTTRTTNFNRKIRNNIILNSIGAKPGAERYDNEPFGKGAGIYLDEHVNGVEITGNTIANGDWCAIFLHNGHDNVVTGNLVYNYRYLLTISQYDANGRNNIITGNQFIAKTATQNPLAYRTYFKDTPASLGKLDNNYYARPLDDSATIRMDDFWSTGAGTYYITLNQWKASYKQDAASNKSPLTYTANIDDSLRFEYNDGYTTKIINLPESYVDVKNTQYAGSVGLAPFTGLVLLKSKNQTGYQLNQVINFPSLSTKTYGDDGLILLKASSTSGLPVSYRLVSGPAKIFDKIVTLTGPGTVVIEASQAGNYAYKPAEAVTQSFEVLAPNVQSISFPAIPDKAFGTGPFPLAATSSSGLPVSYQVISGLASVNGNMVTLNGASVSTVIIEATQTGDGNYQAAAPVRQKFTVSPGDQVINFAPISGKTYSDAPFALTITSSSGLPVSYKILSGPATLNGNVVTLTGVGEVFIEASQAGDSNYKAAPNVTRNFYVSKGAQTISFPAPPNKTYLDPPFALTATASSGLPVSFRVTSGPATINGNQLTISGTGEIWIEANQGGNDLYNPAPGVSQKLNVSKAAQTITFPNIPARSFSDAPVVLMATASSGLPVSYRLISGNAVLSGNIVTITGGGEVWIEATQPGDNNYTYANNLSRGFWVSADGQDLNVRYEWSCPNTTKSLYAGTSRNDVSYQWQIDKHDGNGFVNLADNGLYSGSSTPTLLLVNAPTAIYGYAYRCRMSGGQTTEFSAIMLLKFYAVWTGSVDSNWANAANWSCGILPDANTDAVIQAGAPRYPVVNSNASCHGVKVETGATLTLTPGYQLTITGKAP